MLNYVNPMAMNTWAVYARYPHIKQAGLCHSVQGTAEELARDLDLDPGLLQLLRGHQPYGILFIFREKAGDGSYVSLYPDLLQATLTSVYRSRMHGNPRQNIVRYEMFKNSVISLPNPPEHFRRIYTVVYQTRA
jgi:alpha-galactosidase